MASPFDLLSGALQQGLTGIGNTLSNVQHFGQSFGQPAATPAPMPQIQYPAGTLSGHGQPMVAPTAQPTAQPTQAPLLSQPTTQQNSGFKYQMGQKDYSSLRPQIQTVLKGTPLESMTEEFIKAGNTHGIDPRVLITIANNESSLGKNYPTDTYNPFGYNARNGGTIVGKDGKTYINTDKGLKDAGFTSLPMAIDRLTQRFSDHPVNATPQSYAEFRKNPTIENLAAAYNASKDEMPNYIKSAHAFAANFGGQ